MLMLLSTVANTEVSGNDISQEGGFIYHKYFISMRQVRRTAMKTFIHIENEMM
jgi:hypothetical protein